MAAGRARTRARALHPPVDGGVDRTRVALADGARTTVYVASYALARIEVEVVVLSPPERLAVWCDARGVSDAIVGGFFTRSRPEVPSRGARRVANAAVAVPLGDLRTGGVARAAVPFDAPWDAVRACIHVEAGHLRIVRRDELGPTPRGDLLQAGPLLVRDARPVFDREADAEGFRRGARQFDSDITDGRHPRAALGIAGDRLLAVACDGRAGDEAGLSLDELGALLAELGCDDALNLDGGGSTTLICAGRLVNRPRGAYEVPEPGGRAVATALVFSPR